MRSEQEIKNKIKELENEIELTMNKLSKLNHIDYWGEMGDKLRIKKRRLYFEKLALDWTIKTNNVL